jgi:DNA-binding CsgD family transcriptional regulator
MRRRARASQRAARVVLGPPANTEASIHRIDGEELLVFRIPLRDARLGEDLSAAEREVAMLALSGASNADIAQRRGTSTRTVANQMAAIFRKLDVGSRAELARRLVGGEDS